MSEERLEEIKSRVWKDKGTYAMGDENQREGYIYTLSDYDYKWLIEQAKQVSALETTIDFYQSALRDADRRVQELEVWRNEVTQNVVERNSEYEKCREQNKRYREAIEETLQAMGMVDRQKYGSKLEKALKGE